METPKKLAVVHAIALAAAASVIYVTAVTIAADLWSPLKNFLKQVFTHHWIGKGVTAAALFLAIAAFASKRGATDETAVAKILMRLVAISVAGSVAITLFFLYEKFLR